MARYQFMYSGFAYIEADNLEEAEEKYAEHDFIYDENQVNRVLAIDEFVVEDDYEVIDNG